MRQSRTWLVAAVAAVAIGCSSSSTGPSSGGNNTGGAGGGPVGQIIVSNNFFQSAHNGTTPAQDTVPAGQTVTWTWTGTGSTFHSVVSDGPAAFPGSGTPQSGDGTTYMFTFTTPGTYNYHCAVHGPSMHGTLVVQ
ncbi:MAG TPA: cupredoxin domain-containing protein [Gemmatimonadales bacterium]|nr:cupredoxin domain-containing protein [Gemmatimonadales bacterium]